MKGGVVRKTREKGGIRQKQRGVQKVESGSMDGGAGVSEGKDRKTGQLRGNRQSGEVRKGQGCVELSQGDADSGSVGLYCILDHLLSLRFTRSSGSWPPARFLFSKSTCLTSTITPTMFLLVVDLGL